MKRYKIMYGICLVVVISTAIFLILSVLPRSMGYLGARNLYELIMDYGSLDGISSSVCTPEMGLVWQILLLDVLHATVTGKKAIIIKDDSMAKLALRLVCYVIIAGVFVCGVNYLREYTWFK